MRSRNGGVEGNERLTVATALVLMLLLAAEGITLLFIRPLLPVHVFIGMMLVPPVLLKLGSTGWRLMRYYQRRRNTPRRARRTRSCDSWSRRPWSSPRSACSAPGSR